MENKTELKENPEQEEITEERSPLLVVIIYGLSVITLASIAKLIVVWVNFPGSVSSIKEFFAAVVESFVFVLNFDFKVWWVFLLVLYLVARFYKK